MKTKDCAQVILYDKNIEPITVVDVWLPETNGDMAFLNMALAHHDGDEGCGCGMRFKSGHTIAGDPKNPAFAIIVRQDRAVHMALTTRTVTQWETT